MNWYAVLSVDSQATPDEIRKAYRQAALKYHPDKNSDEDAAFKFDLVNRAFSILSDPVRRAQFDAEIGVVSQSSAESHEIRQSERTANADFFAQKLASQERHAQPTDKGTAKHEFDAWVNSLRTEMENKAKQDPEFRTLAGNSRQFESVKAARQFIDEQPSKPTLMKSYLRKTYTKEYELETLARIERRCR